ncbi:hypothetical protein, partial [Lacisediminihabitans profunda]|uniref:hypothetical protein n=1 Tax=Lacisediminihabitans profunda TaxID=2594790 RepID=UPI001650BC49
EQHSRCTAAGGPIFAQLGLIPPRVSPNATVIGDPMHQLQLVLALEGEGWSRVTQSNTGGLLPPVFTRVVHPRLVGPLDSYDICPGF